MHYYKMCVNVGYDSAGNCVHQYPERVMTLPAVSLLSSHEPFHNRENKKLRIKNTLYFVYI